MGTDQEGSARAGSPLRAAVLAGRWIRSAAVDDSLGRRWQANPDPHGRSASAGPSSSLYAGTAGIVLFFLDLAAATGDESYLEDAAAGARRLARTWRDQTDLSLYHGLAGTVFTLATTGWAIGGAGFEEAAGDAADHLVRSVRAFDGEPGWTGDPALRGDGGIVLALLHAAGVLGAQECADAAVEAGERIARLVVPGHRLGDGCADLPLDAVTPGFLTGTAGATFVLARLFGVTGDEKFLAAARRGAQFVRTVCTLAGRCAYVPHHVPHGRDLHYLGFCSGSAGVARMFHELHLVAGDPADLDWERRLAHGVVQSGVPANRTAGYWNVACQCCGAAGLIELFTGMWAATGDESHLEFARTLADDLIARATGDEEQGLRWYQAYRRQRPQEITADTGYLVGAAGIGAALLHLDAASRPDASQRLVLLPDNPFPAIPMPAPSPH